MGGTWGTPPHRRGDQPAGCCLARTSLIALAAAAVVAAVPAVCKFTRKGAR